MIKQFLLPSFISVNRTQDRNDQVVLENYEYVRGVYIGVEKVEGFEGNKKRDIRFLKWSLLEGEDIREGSSEQVAAYPVAPAVVYSIT